MPFAPSLKHNTSQNSTSHISLSTEREKGMSYTVTPYTRLDTYYKNKHILKQIYSVAR